MRILKVFIVAVTSLALFAGCKGPSVEKDEDSLTLSVEVLEFGNEKSSKEISLLANHDWSVSGELPKWLSINPLNGIGFYAKQPVTVSVVANDGEAREHAVTIMCGTASKTLLVKQEAVPAAPVAPKEEVLFKETFTESLGAFTVVDKNRPDALKAVWEYSEDYECAKGTAYVNATQQNLAAESWLISPEIDLTQAPAAYMTFEHAGGYFGTPKNEATVWITKDDGANWSELKITTYPTSWAFIPAGTWNLKDYLGSKVKVAFKYLSTSTKAGTWEIRNLTIATVEEVKDAPSKVTGWLELPAMTDAQKQSYYSHSFKLNNKNYRNYSFVWDEESLVASWVAYPLCGIYTNKAVERSEDWTYNPNLSTDIQPSFIKGFVSLGYSGYDRGHQIPSADRLCCTEANEQTFYFTNATAQNSQLNQGTWGKLEDKVRSWSNYLDTLYVVTGCTVAGSDKTVKDHSNPAKTVVVPSGYYKALLGYKKSLDGETQGYVGLAFYFDHKNYDTYTTQAMTIDQLEEKLGMDMFVNLTEKIGKDAADKVEAKIDPWWKME